MYLIPDADHVILHLNYVRNNLTWESLYPKWIDEEEESEILVCPSLSALMVLENTHIDVIAVKHPCQKSKNWSRDVARLHLQLAAARLSASVQGYHHSAHVLFVTDCFPNPNVFTCKELVGHKGNAWLYKPNLSTLREKLWLPIGSCELAVPLKAKGERIYSGTVHREAYATILHSAHDYVYGAIAAAQRNNATLFNSGVMVIEPSNCRFQLLMDHINEIESYNGGDQGYLNEIFTWWHRIPKHMNFLKHFCYEFLQSQFCSLLIISLRMLLKLKPDMIAYKKYHGCLSKPLLRDETYFTGMMKSSAYNLDSTVISYYFPLSQCIERLKVLVQSLFGATFHSFPLAPGESWHVDVLKMYYAWDYRFLRKFAKHYLTGEVIPKEVVESMKGARNMFTATELQRQIMYAIINQTLFGELSSSRDTISVVEDLRKFNSWKHVEGTHWHTRFNHLINYGVGYYSYIYAKCLAAIIWADVCAKDPLSLATGTTLRAKLLQHGGAKEASTLLKDLVGSDGILRYHGKGLVPNLASLC
ncbi:hypothetical protein GIB67_013958 [Kingdonia uniflora]|uniref:Peptidase M3A/M3B catalytic domain-containing protein n=1 Tax=Kingdonia uniflora TaxID=39325 RepID=A0A7J7LDG8_9MAGN|nr:hypothetical protein GIB67_013958 [Kingdonia uniflora]